MTQAANILIKIFSGPHLGAEIPLDPGGITLGTGSSCDVILKDTTVAERHLKIFVPDNFEASGELVIETIDAPVILLLSDEKEVPEPILEPGADPGGKEPDSLIDSDQDPGLDLEKGEKLVEGESTWKPLTPIMIGTTCIAWTREGEDWGDVAGFSVLSGGAFGRTTESVDAGKSKEDLSEDQEKKKKTIVVPVLWSRLLKGVGILLIFLFLFGPCLGIKDTRFSKNMKGLLEDEGFDYLTVTQTSIGVTILGTVDTQAERNRLWQLAGKADYPVFIDIRVNEERAYAVKVALSVRGLFPEVRLDDQDIIINGYMRDKLIEGAAKIWIRNDIAQVSNIESSMVYAFQVWPVLKDRLIKYELGKLVKIRFHPGLVQVEGELDFDQRHSLEQVKKEVCEALNSPVAFWDTLTAPGFSDEWNASLNSSMRSEYAPDPGLAQLFLDSHSAKGVPAFVASTPEYKAGPGQMVTPESSIAALANPVSNDALEALVKEGEKIVDKNGKTIAVITDEEGNVQGGVLLDKEGKIVQTPSGDPIILPVIKDKTGQIVKDSQGRPVFAKPLTDDQGEPVFGPTRDEDGKKRSSFVHDDDGNILVDDQGRILSGDVLRNEDGTIKRDEDGNILVKDSQGNIVKARPAARDDDGNILVDDQGRILSGDVLRNEDGTIKRDEDGNILVKDGQGNIVKARPAARDDDGNILVDDQGRILSGDVLRNEDGTLKRDEDGNILVKDGQGNIIPGKSVVLEDRESPLAVITGPARDGDGNIIRDQEGNPVMGRAAFDDQGRVITDGQGNPVILGTSLDKDGRPLRDTQGQIIPLTIARNADGRVVRDQHGNPLLVPALVDKEGRIVRDENGRPVAPRVISGAGDRAVFDKDGRLILDQDANNVLTGKTGLGNLGDSFSGQNQEQDGSSASDKEVFGSGTAIADKEGQVMAEDPLGGLSITSITLEPIAFIGMKDGQKFFNGGKLPSGYVIKSIGTDKIIVEKLGKTRTINMRQE